MSEDLYLQIIKKQQELIHLYSLLPLSKPQVNRTDNEPVVTEGEIIFDPVGFRDYLEKSGLSESSKKTYFTQVQLFFKSYQEITTDNLKKWESSLDKFNPKTQNIKTLSLEKYLSYIGLKDYYSFKKVKIQTKAFCDNVISKEQYDCFIEWSKENDKKAFVIAKTIANTGVRIFELICLKSADLDVGYADLVGKGSKQRRIYYPKSLIKEIAPYVGKKFIAENRFGNQYSREGAAAKLISAGEKAGIPKEVMHPHSFRHFFAKQFLKKNDDITLLGDLLGHSDISTTAIYTRKSSKEQRNEVNNLVNW